MESLKKSILEDLGVHNLLFAVNPKLKSRLSKILFHDFIKNID